eukprot:61830_1
MSSANKKDKKNKSSSRLDDYLHTKPEQWTQENILLYILPAVLMALIPSWLYWGAYDYSPDGFIGIEYVFHLVAIGCTASGLLSAYTHIYVETVHFLKCSSQSKGGEKQTKLFETQSKWWALFYVNAMFITLFLLANFYAFKTSIPNIHFRFGLSAIAPSVAVHLWVNGNNQRSTA